MSCLHLVKRIKFDYEYFFGKDSFNSVYSIISNALSCIVSFNQNSMKIWKFIKKWTVKFFNWWVDSYNWY